MKIMLFAAFLLLASTPFLFAAYDEYEELLQDVEKMDAKTETPPSETQSSSSAEPTSKTALSAPVRPLHSSELTSQVQPEKLIDMGSAQMMAQIQGLERRIVDLERQHRFQEDRMRSLDRAVNDLKRYT